MVTKRVRFHQNKFTKGELDRSLWGHGDLAGYYEGVASAKNVWINGIGSVVKRYGLTKVCTYSGVEHVRMYPFDIVSGRHWVVVIYPGRIEVIDGDRGEVVAVMEASVFSGDIIGDLYGLSFQDSVIFTNNAMPPQQLKWTSGNNFTLTEIAFSNIPTFEFTVNDVSPSGTITPSGASGFIVLTSNVSVFDSSDVGKYVSMLPVGRLRITGVNSGTVVAGYLEENLFDQSVVPAGNWTIERGWAPLWGGSSGYPGVVGFHEGRMIVGNFPRARSVFAYSMINSPFDYSMGDGTAAYGGWRILSYDQGEAICHIVSEHALYFFCAKGEYVIEQSSGEQLSRARIRHDSARGVVASIRPTASEDGSLYFFQRNSTSISEFRYYDERGCYESHSMSRYARHLLMLPCSAALWPGDKIFDTNILFYVNSDGSMVACTINLGEKILACSRVVARVPSSSAPTGAIFTGVCVSGSNIYVSVAEYTEVSGASAHWCSIMRFLSGNYLDDGEAYESKIDLLPLTNETSAYSSSKITVTAVHAYISNSAALLVNGMEVYTGPPVTAKFTHYYPSGWQSDGQVEVSDGRGSEHWQVNNICRTALVGGML
jgi:hypothetical protein